MNDHRDRLIDALLHELLSARPHVDLTARVLRRADRLSRRRFITRAVALAAAVAMALAGAWLARSALDPQWRPGAGAVTDPTRPLVIRAGDGGGTLDLGQRVRIALTPGAEVELEAGRDAPRVRLHEGRIEADVNPGGAGFVVATTAGMVNVTGTRFAVVAARQSPALVVDVAEGEVVASGAWGEFRLGAGQGRSFDIDAAHRADGVPAGARGLSAIVEGVVLACDRNTGELLVRVDAIVRVWPHSRAADPASVMGRRAALLVAASGRAEQSMTALREIRAGDQVRFEIDCPDGMRFRLGELLERRR